jgi:soluble lytic murein transglycosylase-like protein
MDRVTLMLLGVLAAAAAGAMPAHAESAATAGAALDRWQSFITQSARRFGIPEAWIRAVMAAESGGRTSLAGRPITSSAGAMGLMQVMPDTYEDMRQRYGLGTDPHDPRDNILAGTAYLRTMYDRYGYPGLFAAYNAGPGRYDDYLRDGKPLPAETRTYLAALGQTPPTVPSGSRLFFPLRTSSTSSSQTIEAPPPSGGLFVRLRTVPDDKR